MVGTWDNKDQVYGFAALNIVSGQLSTRLLEQPAHSQAQTGRSKAQRLQVAFATHLKDIAQAYPAHTYPEVVITIDNASWHGGALVRQVLEAHAHLYVKRLPSYSPQLNVIDRESTQDKKDAKLAAVCIRAHVFLASPGAMVDKRTRVLKTLEDLQYHPQLHGKITVEAVV